MWTLRQALAWIAFGKLRDVPDDVVTVEEGAWLSASTDADTGGFSDAGAEARFQEALAEIRKGSPSGGKISLRAQQKEQEHSDRRRAESALVDAAVRGEIELWGIPQPSIMSEADGMHESISAAHFLRIVQFWINVHPARASRPTDSAYDRIMISASRGTGGVTHSWCDVRVDRDVVQKLWPAGRPSKLPPGENLLEQAAMRAIKGGQKRKAAIKTIVEQTGAPHKLAGKAVTAAREALGLKRGRPQKSNVKNRTGAG